MKFTVTAYVAKIGFRCAKLTIHIKTPIFIDGLLLAIGIIAIASEEFVSESNVNRSDSYNFSFFSTIKLSFDIVDDAILDSIDPSGLTIFLSGH